MARLKALIWMKPYALRQVLSEEELARLRGLVEVVDIRQDESPTDESLRDPRLAGVEVILSSWGMPVLNERMLEALPSLRAVFHAAGTVKSFVTEAMWQRGVRVFSAADMNAVPVAEFTYSMVVLSLKRVWARITEQREQGIYGREDPYLTGSFRSTVSLLGMGRTGRRVREDLRRLDVEVLAFDPMLSETEAEQLGVTLVSLEDAFRRGQVVSCHIPLLPETVAMLRREHFIAMRPGATFINTARGKIVDEPGLIAALRQRPDLWAVLDVLAHEPPPPGAVLPTLPNVIVTPHVAGSLAGECRRMSQAMIEELTLFIEGAPSTREVERELLTVCA